MSGHSSLERFQTTTPVLTNDALSPSAHQRDKVSQSHSANTNLPYHHARPLSTRSPPNSQLQQCCTALQLSPRHHPLGGFSPSAKRCTACTARIPILAPRTVLYARRACDAGQLHYPRLAAKRVCNPPPKKAKTTPSDICRVAWNHSIPVLYIESGHLGI